MIARDTESGFTLVEMIVTLVIMSLFSTLFINMFSAAQLQRVNVVRVSAANDMAVTNLEKFSTRQDIEDISGSACTSSNDVTQPGNSGLINNVMSGTLLSGWSQETPEAPLPPSPSTSQRIYVVYPQGCDADMPIQVKSVVEFNNGTGTERVIHSAYVR
jgi:prepilin-type N-terminal cleavage/methylation domain-containing protein